MIHDARAFYLQRRVHLLALGVTYMLLGGGCGGSDYLSVGHVRPGVFVFLDLRAGLLLLLRGGAVKREVGIINCCGMKSRRLAMVS